MKLLQNNSIDCKLNNYDNCFISKNEDPNFIKSWNLEDINITRDIASLIIYHLEQKISVKKSNLLCFNIDDNINTFILNFKNVNAIVPNINEYNKAYEMSYFNKKNIKQGDPHKYSSLTSKHFNKLLGTNTVIYMNSDIGDLNNICNKLIKKCKYIIIFLKKGSKTTLDRKNFLKENIILNNEILLINNSNNSNNLVTYLLETLRKELKWNAKTTLQNFYYFNEMEIYSKELLKKKIKHDKFFNDSKNIFSYKNYIDISKIVCKNCNLDNNYQMLLAFLYKKLKKKIKTKATGVSGSEKEINNIYKILNDENIYNLQDLSCMIEKNKLKKKLPSYIIKIIKELLTIQNMECNEQQWLRSISKVTNKMKSRTGKAL